MSDQRFKLDVTFSIYGETFHWNPSLNWAADDDTGIDPRIIDWFANCYAKARGGYDTYVDMKRAEETERWERNQLAQLKAKYECEAVENPT